MDSTFRGTTTDEMLLVPKSRITEIYSYQEVPRKSGTSDKVKLSDTEVDLLFKPDGTKNLINSSQFSSIVDKDKSLFEGISEVSNEDAGFTITNI
jgi:hypothetical protein